MSDKLSMKLPPVTKPSGKEDNFSFNLRTQYNPALIRQTLEFGPKTDPSSVSNQIIHLQETAVKKALRKLGYLEPKKTEMIREAVVALRSNQGGSVEDLLTVIDKALGIRNGSK